MKLVHLADLHLGKRVNGFSMLEDQNHILNQIIELIEAEQPQAVLISGDVYDRAVPPEEAVELFDRFLVRLFRAGIDVYIISGNHDSAERVAFGGRLMNAAGIHPAPVYNGEILPLTLEDEYGTVAFWLIPFLKPAHVRRFFPDAEISSYTDAMQTVVEQLGLDTNQRNVALVHQFLTGAATCDSEESSVGGIDQVDCSVFDEFDYVALGHLHGPQWVGREAVRYAGSPLKYSFSEVQQHKALTVVELGEKGEVGIRTLPLKALRDLRRISGSFSEVMERTEHLDDYYEITLTDEEDVPNALARLRSRYPGLMTLKYDNTRTRSESTALNGGDTREKSPLELFDELYLRQNGQPMNEEQKSYVQGLIEEIWSS